MPSTLSDWSVSPMYLLRKHAVLHALKNVPPGTFLEVGAGTGSLTLALVAKGFHGSCYDISEESLAILRDRFHDHPNITVAAKAGELPTGMVDNLFAFEVLEHIPDDLTALRTWQEKLNPKGVLCISVPAHQHKFSAEDLAVGHVRRYEKDALRALCQSAGFNSIQIISYGYPLGSLSQFIANIFSLSKVKTIDNPEKLSKISGVNRPKITRLIAPILLSGIATPLIKMQRFFFNTNLGVGYVLIANKDAP